MTSHSHREEADSHGVADLSRPRHSRYDTAALVVLDEHTAPGTTAAERALLMWLHATMITNARNATHLREVRGLDHRHHWWSSVLLTHGRLFTPAAHPGHDLEVGEPGTCYATSRDNADHDKALVYVEGMASSSTSWWLTTEHAWCARPRGHRALDPTWHPAGTAYVGVPFTDTWRHAVYAEVGHPCPLLTATHEPGRRLLREGIPPHAVHSGAGRPLPAVLRDHTDLDPTLS